MKLLLRCAVAACLAVAIGCRSNVGKELLERENLSQENEIYQLQDLVDEYQTRLDSCQRENESLLAELGRSRTSGKPPVRPADEPAPPVVEPGAAVPYEGAPVIAPPDPLVPEGEHLAKKRSGRAKAASVPGGRLRKASTRRGPIDQVVMQITLNRKLTGGHNVDGHPGDEGVMLVIEPLNAAGELVEVPGEVSVVILDPALEGEAARIARWDFKTEDAAAHVKRTPLGDGLHFDLRWPHSPPTHRVLNLYVRYTTADGRRLQVEKQIEVDPPAAADAPDDRVTKTPPEPNVADGHDAETGPSLPGTGAKAVEPADDEDRQTDAQSTTTGKHWTPLR
ncbi:MAG TPA: hypothetical protein VNH11_28655 [Pirellulales bacterium]|nr:hypothetical protein [Pirellulales bacterium]